MRELIRRETRDGAEIVERILRIARSRGRPSKLVLDALQELGNRLEGKPVSSLELSGPAGTPLLPGSTMEEELRRIDQIAERLLEHDRREAGEPVDPMPQSEPETT